MSDGHAPYRALRHRDFRRLWLGQIVSLVGTQMQSVALHWHVYVLTGSPLALGLIGLSRVVPIVVLSLWSGIVADRHDRRRVMLAAQSAMAVFSAGLAIFTFSGRETLGALYALNALLACAAAFDIPARQAYVPRLVPPASLPGALALNLTGFQTALIVGPALAGLLIAGGASPSPVLAPLARLGASARTAPLALIYGLNALSFLVVIWTLATLETSGRAGAAEASEPPLRALRAGLRFVFTTPLMVWTTALDFLATFFSGAMSLLPIVADQVLHAGPAGYGWLESAPALGALLGSFATSLWPLPRRQGRILLGSIAAYGLATIVYGLSRSFLLTFLALAGTGLADVVSTVIRQTLRQLLTPDALRGRMTSVNMIFFMGGPQLGEVEAGFVAHLFASAALGVTVSIVSGGVATLLAVAAVGLATPLVRNYVGGAGDVTPLLSPQRAQRNDAEGAEGGKDGR
jgi:MFS family permease